MSDQKGSQALMVIYTTIMVSGKVFHMPGAFFSRSPVRTSRGQREVERRSLTWLGLEPYLPVVVFDDLLDDGEADAGPLILLLRVQALEHEEEAITVLGVNAYAVVLNGNHPGIVLPTGGHMYLRRLLGAELDSVADEVLKHLYHLSAVRSDRGQGVEGYGGSALLYCPF